MLSVASCCTDKFETMTTMETQTEEALLKFASGEQETIGDANNSAEPSAGDDEAEAETNLEVWPVDGVDMLPEDAKLGRKSIIFYDISCLECYVYGSYIECYFPCQ